MYLYELVNWLTTVVDSLQISDPHKDEAYHGAAAYIAQCLMVRSPSPSPSPGGPALNLFVLFRIFSRTATPR